MYDQVLFGGLGSSSYCFGTGAPSPLAFPVSAAVGSRESMHQREQENTQLDATKGAHDLHINTTTRVHLFGIVPAADAGHMHVTIDGVT